MAFSIYLVLLFAFKGGMLKTRGECVRKIWDVLVIGGGPSGMMAAIKASENSEVLLLEKMPKCGAKLRITGKGRCNVTTAKTRDEILDHINHNGKFFFSSFAAFNNEKVMQFFEERGCPLKIERGDRVFPKSDKAEDIVGVLLQEMKHRKVHIKTNESVIRVVRKDDHYAVTSVKGEYLAKNLVLATGGNSYPGTGSTGDGYRFAESLGLDIEPLRAALVPLVAQENWVRDLQGLSLRNVELQVEAKGRKKPLWQGFGEMLFTHFGVTGPLVLTASTVCSDYWLKQKEPLKISIDLKPALDAKKINNRILREQEEFAKRQLETVMRHLLPQKLVPVFLNYIKMDGQLPMHQLTKEMREKIVYGLKHFVFHVVETRPLKEGIVTAGGVSVNGLFSKNLEAKEMPGLFVCGELLDLDADTGGYNLQIAFSTGYLVGSHIK